MLYKMKRLITRLIDKILAEKIDDILFYKVWESDYTTSYKFQTLDKDEAWAMMHAMDLYLCLWDMDQEYFRAKLKYDDNLTDKEYDALEEGRDKLREIMADHGVDFENVR